MAILSYFQPHKSSFDRIHFVGIGVRKGGTTALHHYLTLHPDICMAKTKEVHYFNTDSYFEESPDYSFYHSFFSPRPNQIIGEVTPNYIYSNTMHRIWEYNSNLKLIIILRNPIDRAYSDWNMNKSFGDEKLSFMEAISIEDSRYRYFLPKDRSLYLYIDKGFYTKQLRHVWKYFSKENTLVLKHENLFNDPLATMNTVFSFLGVKSLQKITHEEHNKRHYNPMTEDSMNYLKEMFNYEIRELEQLLQWDCSDWLE